MFKKFKSFLEEKEKSLVGDVKTKLVADYEGPEEKYPPSNGKKEKVAPYKTPTSSVDPNKKEKGLADLGDGDLVYEPDIHGEKEKNLGNYPKSKNEAFIEKTSKLDNKTFIEMMLKKNKKNKSLMEGPKNPNNKFEVIKFVADLAAKDKTCVENFIHDSKRSGSLKGLLEYALNLTETYEILAELFQDKTQGNSRFNRLERALEQVGLPQHKSSDLELNKKSSMNDMDDDDMSPDDDMDGMDMDDKDNMDDDDMSSDEDMDDMDDMDMDDEDMDNMDDDMSSDEDMDDDMSPDKHPNKMKSHDDMGVGMLKKNPFSKGFK